MQSAAAVSVSGAAVDRHSQSVGWNYMHSVRAIVAAIRHTKSWTQRLGTEAEKEG